MGHLFSTRTEKQIHAERQKAAFWAARIRLDFLRSQIPGNSSHLWQSPWYVTESGMSAFLVQEALNKSLPLCGVHVVQEEGVQNPRICATIQPVV